MKVYGRKSGYVEKVTLGMEEVTLGMGGGDFGDGRR